MRERKIILGAAALAAGLLISAGSPALADGETGTMFVHRDQTQYTGNFGGGEFGVYNFSNTALLPALGAPVKVNGFDFQTFCIESNQDPLPMDVQLNWTVSSFVNGNSLTPVQPGTAYLYTQFWNGTLSGYNYTLGALREHSADELQEAIWFLQGKWQSTLDAEAQAFVDAANAAVAGSWGNTIGDVRALNTSDGLAPTQDVLVRIISVQPPPPPPPTGNHDGKTPGFWSNKNGKVELQDNPACITLLASLNLFNKNGSAFDPTTVKQVQTWINAQDATNMAAKLSSQLAAMELNMCVGFVDPNSLVDTTAFASFLGGKTSMKIGDVCALANTDLGQPGNNITLTGDADRAYQEALKEIIDAANNNTNWL
jgi:hypothetical protein